MEDSNSSNSNSWQVREYKKALSDVKKCISIMNELKDLINNRDNFQYPKISSIVSNIDDCISALNHSKNKLNSHIVKLKSSNSNQIN